MSIQSFTKYIEQLELQLNTKALPGWDIQYEMSPKHPRSRKPSAQDAVTCRKSSVLLLLHPLPDSFKPALVVTIRSENLSHHGGQVSLPGGGIEPNEEIHAAALRETEEEIGVGKHELEVIGQLTPLYIPVSNNYIYPIVAYSLNSNLQFAPDHREVAEVRSIPIDFLRRTEHVVIEQWNLMGRSVDVPHWKLEGGKPLWGATAMIIHELLHI